MIEATTGYRYYLNDIDVTWYIMNKIEIEGERFFEVVCR